MLNNFASYLKNNYSSIIVSKSHMYFAFKEPLFGSSVAVRKIWGKKCLYLYTFQQKTCKGTDKNEKCVTEI